MIVKLLTEHHLEFLSLKGDCTGTSESTLVKMPYCLKSHATTQIYVWKICLRTCSSDILLFQLAVDHGMGGPDSQAKAEWMVTAVDQWFKENGKIFISTRTIGRPPDKSA